MNPLVLTKAGGLMALDCKFVLDDSAISRHAAALAEKGSPDKSTALEDKAKMGLKFIELDGNVGDLPTALA